MASLPSSLPNILSSPFPSRDSLSGKAQYFFTRLGNSVCCSSKKKFSFTDQILDYIEGGPKLRKWYGAPDLLPKDGGLEDEENGSQEEEETRDAVLVTSGDSEIGQMVILSLILKRAQVKALVKDKRAAVEAFGTYVESIAGDASDGSFLVKALKGVRAIICPLNEGFLSDIGSMKGIQHIVLLSQLAVYRGSSGIQALMNSKAKKLAERDEAAVIASGIPYTIIRAGLLQNSPGGMQGECSRRKTQQRGCCSYLCGGT
ncbi:NAD(P)-binding Rossmann-fold superfamily protein isoform X2 [Tasmannia lanceolata]|uniref:NAD(P)-binding Rossmann-fold superfamily protein isoform X2 n=1 Tax=Tasmannia lanceolata TaxID=3420 RepID=UPI004063DE3F